MFVITGYITGDTRVTKWHCGQTGDDDRIEIQIEIFRSESMRRDLERLIADLERRNVDWMRPVSSPIGDWVFDLHKMRQSFPEMSDVEWLVGRAVIPPEYDDQMLKNLSRAGKMHFQTGSAWGFSSSARLRFVVTPREVSSVTVTIDFPELEASLSRFKLDYPDPRKVGFVMMSFEGTPLQEKAFKTIADTLEKFGLKALRASDRNYSDELLSNVRTYMHGCAFGIAIFERLTSNDFNPNVSLEVGYMMALGKPVCLLKDKTLHTLHSDLVGRLYGPFDTQKPTRTIPQALEKWLADKEFIAR